MGMDNCEEKFYTSEQKKKLKAQSKSEFAQRIPMSEASAACLLDALGEQQNTLQNIEAILQRIEQKVNLDKQNL